MSIRALSSSPVAPRPATSLQVVSLKSARILTGEVDAYEPLRASSAQAATAAAVTLKRDDQSPAVKTWQNQLVSLGYLLSKDVKVKTGDGTFGPKTEAATRQFQHDHGLPETGKFDAATQTKAKQAMAAVTQLSGTTLERGQESEAVRVWQTKLVRAGYLTQAQMDTGPGMFGPQTQAATTAFQQQNALNVSGRVGSGTQAKMTRVIETQQAPTAGTKVEVRNISQLFSVGSEDDWNRNANCAPASVAMIAKAFGFHKTDWSDGKLVNWLGAQAGVGGNGAGWPQVQTMARAAGLNASAPMYGNDLNWVRAQLAAGKIIAANGNRGVTLDHSSYTDGVTGGHWIVIKGVDSAGNFLVEDPSTDCKKLSPAEMQRYFYSRPGGGVGIAIGK
jgi:peptidoglycan hydrolase-like protein with peptidoglycan-binding domain